MRWFAVLALVLSVWMPELGRAQRYKFKYFVEIPPQHYVSPTYRSTFRSLSIPTQTNQNREVLEAFRQPEKGRIQVDLAPVYGTAVISSTGADGSRRSVSESRVLSFLTRYGLSDATSVTFATDYGWWEKSGASLTNPDEAASGSGLSDLRIGILTNREFSARSKVFYGFEAGLSLSKKEEGGKSADGTAVVGNRFSGGHSLSPAIGWQYKAEGNWLVGVRADVTLRQEKRLVTADNREKSESKRNSLAVAGLFEKKSDYGLFGGEIGHEWAEPYSVAAEGGPIEYRDSQNILSLTVYWLKEVKKDLAIKPSFTYSTVPDREHVAGYRFDQYDVMSLQVLMRMEL